jgi:hypothetical protein
MLGVGYLVILSKQRPFNDWEAQDGQTAIANADLRAAPGAGKHIILDGFWIQANAAIEASLNWANSSGGAMVARYKFETTAGNAYGLSNLNLKLPENCKLNWEITVGTAYITVWGYDK